MSSYAIKHVKRERKLHTSAQDVGERVMQVLGQQACNIKEETIFIASPAKTVVINLWIKKRMMTQQEFNLVAASIRKNIMEALPKMIKYKSNIQRTVLNLATRQEIEDVRAGRINQGLIDKLIYLVHEEWIHSKDTYCLYCAAMAVATIIKEYGWGIQYLTEDGLYEIGLRIYNT